MNYFPTSLIRMYRNLNNSVRSNNNVSDEIDSPWQLFFPEVDEHFTGTSWRVDRVSFRNFTSSLELDLLHCDL